MSYFHSHWKDFHKRCRMYDITLNKMNYPRENEWFRMYKNSNKDSFVDLGNVEHHQFDEELKQWGMVVVDDCNHTREDIIEDIFNEICDEVEENDYKIKCKKQFKKDLLYFIYRLTVDE